MSVKNDPPKNQAEIGEALVAALGFEPTDSKKLGRSSGKGPNGSSASKNDGKESAAETIISDGSADGSTVAKGDSSNTESTKSGDADSGVDKNGASDSNGSTGTASRSSSKSRSRKKTKKPSSSGAYESKKSRASKLRSSIEGAPASDKTSDDVSPAISAAAKGQASNDAEVKSDSQKASSTEDKNSASDSEDVTSPIDVATQTRRVSTLPPPPNEDSIRTPGLGVVDEAKPSGQAEAKDSALGKAKAKSDSKADAKADTNTKVANEAVESKPGAHSSNKNVTAETPKVAPAAEADFTPPAAPPVVTPSADTEVLPTTPATIEPNSTAPTAPPTAPIVEAAPAQTKPRVGTKPDIAGPSFFGGRRKVQARKVRRVVRHIDPWSVLIFSVLFHLCIAAALLIASVLVWNAAEAAGTIEQIEDFIRELGDYETFVIDGETIFRAAVGIAGVMTLASSVLLVLLTVMFNLISDLVGGIRVTVIEEETIRVKRK